MLEDAPPKKPPDRTVLPYGPKVQTVKIPIEATEAKTFIRQLSTTAQTPLIPYKYLTGEEYKKNLEDNINNEKDPCEKDLECKQDKEIREIPENPENLELNKLNWKHKDKIAEAEGVIIKPNREWTPGYIPETDSDTKKKEKEQLEIAGTQTKQQVEDRDKEIKYDPEQAFKDSRRKGPGSNPVSVLNLVRTLKENKKTGLGLELEGSSTTKN